VFGIHSVSSTPVSMGRQHQSVAGIAMKVKKEDL